MIPQALRERQQWLVWKLVQKPGKTKADKIPYYCNGAIRKGVQGSKPDRDKLTTFEQALEAKTRRKFDGIGFAFVPDDGLIGIDLDDAIDKHTDEESGEVTYIPKERAAKIIAACASFTELSPSRTGVHIYVRGTTESFKSNDIGVEVFCGRQFFTVTGEHLAGTTEQVNDLDITVLGRLRATVDVAKGARKTTATAPTGEVEMDARAKVESALAVLNPECGYEEWLQLGMAIHAELGDGGFAVWDYWSGKSAKYPGQKVLESHWKSFRSGGGITGATLFKLAGDAGWRAPRPKQGSGIKPKPRHSGAGNSSEAAGGNAPPGDEPPPPEDDDGGPFDPDGLPLIEVTAGHLPEAADRAEAVLLKSDVRIYQRDRMLVRVVRRAVPSVRNYKRPAGTLGMMPVELPYLVDKFTRMAHWRRWDARKAGKEEGEKGDWVRINAPDKVASTYMSRAGEWTVPELWSVLTAPTLRPDGTILQKPGYDAAMKAWYDPCGIEFPEIPESPSFEQALSALRVLKKAFSTFPFADTVDEAVALSLALTSLVRRSLMSAPLGAITAPVMGSGKTLLADVISILSSGSAAPKMTYSDNEEEFKKTLLAVLMEGDGVVLMDNVSHPLQGDTLCSILTSETLSQRMLGRSEMVRVQTTTLFLANGNQLVLLGDLRTRALLCLIDPKTEHPEEREFKGELKDWFLGHRPRLVAAGLTLMRAYQVHGKKNAAGQDVPPVVKPYGRFEQWSDMVRAPLVWLGEPDPCASVKQLERDDPARAELRQVLHAWRKLYGTNSKKSSDICKELADAVTAFGDSDAKPLEEALREVARDRDGVWSSRRLSKWLGKHCGRRADGLMLAKGDEKDHTQMWRVDEVADEKS